MRFGQKCISAASLVLRNCPFYVIRIHYYTTCLYKACLFIFTSTAHHITSSYNFLTKLPLLTKADPNWTGSHFLSLERTYSFFLPLLFDHVRQNFGTSLALSVQQVSWNCSFWCLLIIFLFGSSLFVHLNSSGKTENKKRL